MGGQIALKGFVPWACAPAFKSWRTERLRIAGKGTRHLWGSKGGKTPVRNKQQLLDDLRKAVTEATAWCTVKHVNLVAIETLPSGSLERLTKLAAAIDTLISPETIRREFPAHERIVSTLYDAAKPDPAVLEFTPRVSCLRAIADAIRAKINPGPPDISDVMAQIDRLLDDSIESIRVENTPGKLLDLSKIDFEALAKRFKASKNQEHRVGDAEGRSARDAGTPHQTEPDPHRFSGQVRSADRGLQQRQQEP